MLNFFQNMKIIFAVIILLCGVLFRDRIESYYNLFKEFVTQILENEDSGQPGIFTHSQLSKYNGLDQDKLYLSVLGSVFDVTEGRRNYKKGAPYHYFIGKDGSRALVTGNFKDESQYKDHVLDLNCDEIRTLLNWKVTFREKYVPVGKLIGRYYDHNGKKTEYSKQLGNRAKQCKEEKELTMKENEKFPPCNIAWSAEDGSRVWCTKTSGGVSRNWVGVPRQMYTPGKDKPLCVCVNVDNIGTSALFEEYKNCSKTSTSCNLDN